MYSPLEVPQPSYASEDLVIFGDMVRKFFEQELVSKAELWEQDGIVDRSDWKMCGDAGLLLTGMPEKYGGAGGSFAHEATVIQQSGLLGMDGINITTTSAIIAPYVLKYGTEEQKVHWLPRIAAGDVVCSIAMSEPGAGSDLQNIRTTAVRDGDNYIINGQKIFITNSILADFILLACKTDKSAGAKGISLIIVEPKKTEGFSRGNKLDKVGMRAHDTAELFFENARVPVSNLLGVKEGQGFSQMMNKLAEERLVVALQSMAMIERALALTIEYTKERNAFGKRLIDFQNTQFVLAECKTEATAAKVFCNNCVERVVDGSLDATTASMAKLWLSELQAKIIDRCQQLFGGYGYMNEYPIAQMYRDCRVSRIYGGTSEIMKLLIARSL